MRQFGEAELQYRIVYAIIVAGKNAKFAEAKTKALFHDWDMPFEMIKHHIRRDYLGTKLRQIGTGNYTKIEKALKYLVESNIDLETCTAEGKQ